MKIVQIGDGAIGSPTRVFGRNWGVEYVVIDFDHIEAKNTQAQMHTKMGLRRNKAQSAAQMMAGFWGQKIKAIPHKLTWDNYKQLLGGADLLIDCTDNAEARKVIQQAAGEFDIPCVHGCLAVSGDFARIVWTEIFSPQQEDPNVPTCEDGENLPFYSLVGAHIAQTVQHFLKTGEKRSLVITPLSVVRIH